MSTSTGWTAGVATGPTSDLGKNPDALVAIVQVEGRADVESVADDQGLERSRGGLGRLNPGGGYDFGLNATIQGDRANLDRRGEQGDAVASGNGRPFEGDGLDVRETGGSNNRAIGDDRRGPAVRSPLREPGQPGPLHLNLEQVVDHDVVLLVRLTVVPLGKAGVHPLLGGPGPILEDRPARKTHPQASDQTDQDQP